MYAQPLQYCLTLCHPIDCSLPGSSVYGIFPGRYWSALPCPPPGDLLNPGIETVSPVSAALWEDSLLLSSQGAPVSTVPLNLLDQIRSVAQSCPTLCDPMNHSTPGLPVHHQLPEFTQTHVHRVTDTIQPSHPLSFPSPPAPKPSQHQNLFQ